MGVRPAPDNYFVRINTVPVAGQPSSAAPTYEPRRRRRRRGRRRRLNGRSKFLLLVAIGLGAWTLWASQQPGGVSGTINGWIDHVRGDVQDVGAGHDLKDAANYFDDQFAKTGTYPVLSDSDLTAAGISIDVDEVNCSGQAVVLQTVTVSRLLLNGEDKGDVAGRVGCPANLADPKPWKS